MKRKLNILIFTLFVCFFSVSLVSAKEFNCKIGNYTIRYNSSGAIVSAKNSSGNKINKALSSYFKPTKKSECPTDAEARVSIVQGGTVLYVEMIDQTNKDMGSCAGYKQLSSCKNNNYYACVWNETEYGNYCNTDNLLYVSCGETFDIPNRVPELINFFVNLLKIATPLILIFVSIITLFKAVVASKEDEMKKAQSSLIKKIIAAIMVFFIISIVQFVIMKVADSGEKDELSTCLSCFLNNDCSKNIYYKTNVSGTYLCTYIEGSGPTTCKGNK